MTQQRRVDDSLNAFQWLEFCWWKIMIEQQGSADQDQISCVCRHTPQYNIYSLSQNATERLQRIKKTV